MGRRQAAVATVSVVLGALAASGGAYGGSSERAPGGLQARDQRVLCERLDARIQHRGAKTARLGAFADRIEQKIASSELTLAQEARANAALAKIARKQAILAQRLERLLRVHAEKCD